MKVLLVVNTSASSVTARGRVVIQKALSADHDVSMAETSRRGHASRLAQGAAADGVDVVVVLGGDGTLNEAANGLAGTDTALAVLPGGSTNVFARTIGLPNDPIEATGSLLSALGRGAIRRVGLGNVNGRYFLFNVGIGFDAAVVQQVERRGDLKRYAGHPLFVWAAFTTWFRHFDRSRPRFAIQHEPGGEVVDDGYFTLVQNTNPYTFLGSIPLDTAPDAGLDEPLTALTFRSLDMIFMLSVVVAALRGGGRLHRMRHLAYRTNLTGLTLTGYGPVPYQVDGDFLGESERLVFRHEPDCLNLVLP